MELAPRYDSANSFLTITKYDKVAAFVQANSYDRERLIQKYKGVRTKLRIISGSISQNSIEELLSAQYDELLNIPTIIKSELAKVDEFISKVSEVNIDSINKMLGDYNIKLGRIYIDFYKMVMEIKLKEYETKKVLYKK